MNAEPRIEALARAQAISVDGSYERLWVWRQHAEHMVALLRLEGYEVVAPTPVTVAATPSLEDMMG